MLTLPNCKINVGLHVVAKRPDGFHDLETLFYPVPWCDALELTPVMTGGKVERDSAIEGIFTLSGRRIEGAKEDNLVMKVYRAMREEFSLPATDIVLTKNLPTGAGLGGGSSDAAFTMTALNELYDLGLSPDDMEQRMSRFGADCAFFVRNKAAFATGIGDQLEPSPVSLKGMWILLVKPSVSVSTAEAYRGVTPRRRAFGLREALSQPIETWCDTVTNDFEEPVFAAHPELAAIKQTLLDMGAAYAAMSGSGSTIYGLFRRPVEEAERVFKDCLVHVAKL